MESTLSLSRIQLYYIDAPCMQCKFRLTRVIRLSSSSCNGKNNWLARIQETMQDQNLWSKLCFSSLYTNLKACAHRHTFLNYLGGKCFYSNGRALENFQEYQCRKSIMTKLNELLYTGSLMIIMITLI